jgi:cytidylate kinase
MAAITISRQLGSLGDEVAQAIGKRLGFRVISRELINQAAIRCGEPEVALAVIDDLGLLGIHPSLQARRAFLSSMERVLQELAGDGEVVIIGRAGQVILRGLPDILHVKIIAPTGLRAERLARQLGIELKAAEAQIEASDRSRRNFLRRYYQARWDDPELYDLIINTARLDPDQAACLVCQSAVNCIMQPS